MSIEISFYCRKIRVADKCIRCRLEIWKIGLLDWWIGEVAVGYLLINPEGQTIQGGIVRILEGFFYLY